MMADQRAMMTEMTGADQRLDELVGNMNAASSMDKADATAAVVDEIDTQRRTLRDGVMKMQRGLRAHTVEHIQAGMDSMAMRPVMNQAGGGIR
jgi:predicted transcriptional regulator